MDENSKLTGDELARLVQADREERAREALAALRAQIAEIQQKYNVVIIPVPEYRMVPGTGYVTAVRLEVDPQ